MELIDLCFTKPAGCFWCTLKFKNHWLRTLDSSFSFTLQVPWELSVALCYILSLCKNVEKPHLGPKRETVTQELILKNAPKTVSLPLTCHCPQQL